MATNVVGVIPTKKRFIVLAVIFAINFTVWLDSSIFGVLTPFWSDAYSLNTDQIAKISASYLLGYFPMLFISGVLADRLGAKKMLLICLTGVTIMSAAMLWVHSYFGLYLRNLLFGIAFGFLWAPCNKMIAMWVPGNERARYTAIWMSFCTASGILGGPLALLMAANIGWKSVFLLVTVLGIPLIFLLALLTTDRPEKRSGISKEEVAYIYSDRPSADQLKAEEFHWSHLVQVFKQRSVWTMAIATGLATTPTWMIGTWGSYGSLKLFQVSPNTLAWVSPLLALIPFGLGFVNGWVVNNVFGGRLRPGLALGPLVSGLAMLAAALLSPGFAAWAILLFGLGFVCNPFFWGSINSYWSGLVKPEYSGSLNGLSAGLQVAVGYLIVNASGKWINPAVTGPASLNKIWIIGGIIFLAAVVFVFLSKEVKIEVTQNSQNPSNSSSQAI